MTKLEDHAPEKPLTRADLDRMCADMHREFAKVWAEFSNRRDETPPEEVSPTAEPECPAETGPIHDEVASLRTETRQALRELSRDVSFLRLVLDNFKPELDGLQNHVRGLEAVVREGFTKLTELINTDTESGSRVAR